MPAPLPLSEQTDADDRLRSALLSRFIVAGFSELDAQEASNLVAGLVWLILAGRRALKDGAPQFDDDVYLRPEEAGKLISVSRAYFYRHEKELPFVVRLSTGNLRVSKRGLLEWARKRRPHESNEPTPAPISTPAPAPAGKVVPSWLR